MSNSVRYGPLFPARVQLFANNSTPALVSQLKARLVNVKFARLPRPRERPPPAIADPLAATPATTADSFPEPKLASAPKTPSMSAEKPPLRPTCACSLPPATLHRSEE